MIDPSSNAYYRWLAILSIAIVYNTVIVVPRAVFDELQEGDYVIAWFVLDYISDAMYVADMIIHVITGRSEMMRLHTLTRSTTPRSKWTLLN